MAKVKNKRNAGAADRAQQKRKAEANKKKLNPFEVHINREKHKVLGKKTKHDRGLPGVSRAKAVQKRKETLGTEMKLMHKTNTFIDKRIGEKNSELSAEDRMVARFAAERAKQHSRKNIYNLADDEVLTHRGQTLEQIEKFDDPRSDEEDESGFKGLDDDFVSEGHFGGGVLSKSDKDGAKSHKDLIEQLIAESKKRKAEKQKEKEQTLDLTEKLDSEWKDLQPVVFKKMRVEEESAIDKVLNKAEKNSQDYDKMMRELRFEKRGTPSDAIKSDEKLEQEEKLRIAQLEKEREKRMRGDYEETAKVEPAKKHRSADDLDDNFELEDEKEFMLAYDKDGKPLVPEHILKDYSVPNAQKQYDDGLTESEDDDDDDENEENSDDDDESGDEEESEQEEATKSKKGTNSDKKVVSAGKEKSEDKEKSILFKDSDDSEEDESGESDDDDEPEKDTKIKTSKVENSGNDESSSAESEEENETQDTKKINTSKAESKSKIETDDDCSKANESKVSDEIDFNGKDDSDEESSESDDDEEMEDKNKINKNEKSTKSKVDSVSGEDSSEEDDSEPEETQNNVQKKETNKRQKLIGDSDSEDDNKQTKDDSDDEIDEQLKSYLGKTAEYENFKELLSGKNPSQQSTAIQKLIKTYDPSLGENNKDKLSRLFANMLQYVNDLFSNLTNEGELMKSFLIFNDITKHFYDIAHINKVSSRKFFAELLKEKYEAYKKKPKRIPNMDTLIFFKLISILYPTSDFRHPLTSPSLTFMSQILHSCRFNDAYSISRGLFLVTLILEYTVLSKRFVPSAINFIRGILYLSAKTTVLNPIKVVPPFRLHKDAKILNLEDDCSKLKGEWKMSLNDLLTDTIDNGFKIRIVYNSIMILREFFEHCGEMEAQECIFNPHIQLMTRLDVELYPKKVASAIEETIKYMKGTLEVKTYTPLTSVKAKPKVLRLYEPDIQEVFTGSKSSKLSRETAERQRLEHKIKREMKGALREIRRDKAYIASVKIKNKIQSDNMRKEKVKQIYKDASIQQGELNKMKRGK
ncbi:nucleolar protein 14 homolog [Leguminivora glycinivorella]|uniref:nucleolar protein 14 homolog n=1 Tax=Leguminivora glycinivorella TaxID=1035111 RepID=UPI00200DCD41|nr:nucleolar protein 14 homolog [Leguminivora glycinivorella]